MMVILNFDMYINYLPQISGKMVYVFFFFPYWVTFYHEYLFLH